MTTPTKRGGHGRGYSVYDIVPRGGGEPVPHTRATDIAGVLDDRKFLELWGKRMVARGLNARPDLQALVSVLGPEKGPDEKANRAEKAKLNRICDDAISAAQGGARANIGTALHTLTENIDRGQDVAIPPVFAEDIAAYRATIAGLGIEVFPNYIERVCICTKLAEPVAGTPDRIVRWKDQLYIADLKTGDTMHFIWQKTAIQMAIYSRAESLYDKETGTHEDMPEVSQDWGIVFHLPAGNGVCTPYLLDLKAGWEGAQASVAARRWRKRGGLSRPMAVEV